MSHKIKNGFLVYVCSGCWIFYLLVVLLDFRPWQPEVPYSVYVPFYHCDRKDFKKRLPSAILIGERRTGTSAIVHFLCSMNKRVRAPYGEMHFFDDKKRLKGLDYYRHLMPPSCPDDVTMEKTPKYFRHPEVVQRIYKFNPNVKLLLSLRDPLDRTLSDYHFEMKREFVKTSREKYPLLNFHEQFKYYATDAHTGEVNVSFPPITRSLYDLNLERWLKYFNRKQFHIIDADNFTRDPISELRKVEQFLGVESQVHESRVYFDEKKGFYCLKGTLCDGLDCGHVYPPLEEELGNKMIHVFRPHILNLYNMIGYKLSWMDKYL